MREPMDKPRIISLRRPDALISYEEVVMLRRISDIWETASLVLFVCALVGVAKAQAEVQSTQTVIEKRTCSIRQVNEPGSPQTKVSRWHFKAVLHLSDGTTQEHLVSIREKRRQALMDCDDWLTHEEKLDKRK